MLACERPWLRVPWSWPCRTWARQPQRWLSSHGGLPAYAKLKCLKGTKASRGTKLQLRSQNSRSEAKAQLLQYLGCFNRGSGNAADVRTLISDLELLPELENSLVGYWTLIGWISWFHWMGVALRALAKWYENILKALSWSKFVRRHCQFKTSTLDTWLVEFSCYSFPSDLQRSSKLQMKNLGPFWRMRDFQDEWVLRSAACLQRSFYVVFIAQRAIVGFIIFRKFSEVDSWRFDFFSMRWISW